METFKKICNLHIKTIFRNRPRRDQIKFTGNPDWKPPISQQSEIINGFELLLNKKIKALSNHNKIKPNISIMEQKALTNLGKK